tara:strand:- start:44 stop:562 length:519 start_codon:yes stop_codon:yes gene_type:complete
MECLVFAKKMSSINLELSTTKCINRINKSVEIKNFDKDFFSNISIHIEALRKSCWENIGVSRSKNKMDIFFHNLQNDKSGLIDNSNSLLNVVKQVEIDQKLSFDEQHRRAINLLIDLQNRQITTKLLVEACLFREESRGGHYRTDYTHKNDLWKCHSNQIRNKEIKKSSIQS